MVVGATRGETVLPGPILGPRGALMDGQEPLIFLVNIVDSVNASWCYEYLLENLETCMLLMGQGSTLTHGSSARLR